MSATMVVPRPLPTITEAHLQDLTNAMSLSRPSSRTTRRLSPPRRLPTVPNALCCKFCKTAITSRDAVVPSSVVPGGRGFRGFTGKASLFTEVQNIKLQPPKKMLMTSGCHTLQQIDCSMCNSQYLGFKIVKSCDESEQWKEGHFLLELESLLDPDASPSSSPLPPPMPPVVMHPTSSLLQPVRRA